MWAQWICEAIKVLFFSNFTFNLTMYLANIYISHHTNKKKKKLCNVLSKWKKTINISIKTNHLFQLNFFRFIIFLLLLFLLVSNSIHSFSILFFY